MATVYGYTANFRLIKNVFNAPGWHLDHWTNLDVIDGLIAANEANIPFSTTPTGTGDAIVLDFTPSITYTNGQQISFVASAANTGAVTVNCDGLGVKSIKTAGGAALTAGVIANGAYVRAIYNGTVFTLIAPGVTATSNNTFTSGASGVTSPVDADDLNVENSGNVGVSLNSPAGYAGVLNFGRPLSPSAGRVKYDHATDKLTFSAGSGVVATFDAVGNLTIPGSFKATKDSFFSAQTAYGTANLPVAGAKMKFNPRVNSSGDGAYDQTTGVYTVPVAGYYLVSYSAYVNCSSATGLNWTLKKNTTYLSTDTTGIAITDSAAGVESGITAIWHFDVGDTVGVEFATGYVGVVSKWKGHFMIKLISADNA